MRAKKEKEGNPIETVKVLIADDTEQYCKELKDNLEKYNGIEILGIANTDEEERKMIEELKPEVVITDLIRHGNYGAVDIIKEYESKEMPKFIIASFCSPSIEFTRYNNVKGFIVKNIGGKDAVNYDMLVQRLKEAKDDIIKYNEIKEQEIEKEKNRKKGILEKIKEYFK